MSERSTYGFSARAVKELLDERVTVCLGQDDISDGHSPFGRNNMLEVAFLAAHLLWITTNRELETLDDMITITAERAWKNSLAPAHGDPGWE